MKRSLIGFLAAIFLCASTPLALADVTSPITGIGYQEGSFTGTTTGHATPATGTIYFVRVGKLVTLNVPTLTGTSNAATFTVTGLPASITPARNQGRVLASIEDNTTVAEGYIAVTSSGTIAIAKSLTASGSDWTTSGSKTLSSLSLSYTLN